jgi:SAM-dependent methyltransferase
MYYTDKLESLKDIFGTKNIAIQDNKLIAGTNIYPIIDDVIILLEPSQYPASISKKLKLNAKKEKPVISEFAEDIQFTFGDEWQTFPDILPEHYREFLLYFDLVNLDEFKNKRVCDLGCGIGRWSYYLKDKCRELVLLDFSEAIFVARRNLKDCNNAIFFMGDIRRLPFKKKFADFLFCIGVLHHLPTNALDEVRHLKKFSNRLLIYLYYSLDNRPYYFYLLVSIATIIRKAVSKIRNPTFRSLFTLFGALFIYRPFIWLGNTLKPFGLSKHVPLHEAYCGKSLHRIRQDVFDRFFTGIEQRVSRKEILTLKNTFDEINISELSPYWHFLCEIKR